MRSTFVCLSLRLQSCLCVCILAFFDLAHPVSFPPPKKLKRPLINQSFCNCQDFYNLTGWHFLVFLVEIFKFEILILTKIELLKKKKNPFTSKIESTFIVKTLALENSNSTLFYHSKKPLYHYTIPFYNTSHIPKLYFY